MAAKAEASSAARREADSAAASAKRAAGAASDARAACEAATAHLALFSEANAAKKLKQRRKNAESSASKAQESERQALSEASRASAAAESARSAADVSERDATTLELAGEARKNAESAAREAAESADRATTAAVEANAASENVLCDLVAALDTMETADALQALGVLPSASELIDGESEFAPGFKSGALAAAVGFDFMVSPGFYAYEAYRRSKHALKENVATLFLDTSPRIDETDTADRNLLRFKPQDARGLLGAGGLAATISASRPPPPLGVLPLCSGRSGRSRREGVLASTFAGRAANLLRLKDSDSRPLSAMRDWSDFEIRSKILFPKVGTMLVFDTGANAAAYARAARSASREASLPPLLGMDGHSISPTGFHTTSTTL